MPVHVKKDFNRRPRLLIHAGLHKTGTTTLQTFLLSACDQLLERGIFYPRTGIVDEGHFNIAWQLMRDRRFSSLRGTIDDLAKEIGGFTGDIILSCEDFESILDEPQRFAPLRFHPAFAEREFIVLVYLRNQGAYAESLYLQLLRHGFGQEFLLFVEQILRFRKLQLDELTLHFDYGGIYSRWAGCQWAHLIMRNYHQLEGGSILTDFFGFLYPSLSGKASETNLQYNQRDTVQKSVTYFYTNRCKRNLTDHEKETLTHICKALHGKRVAMPNEVRSKFSRTFSANNKSFCAQAGLADKGLVEMGKASDDIIPMDRLFSFELANRIAGNKPAVSEVGNDCKGPWRYAQDLGNGWKWLDWFGYFMVRDEAWIYHEQHGSLRCFGTSPDDITFWDEDMKAFWWTSDLLYPYIYRFSDQTWLFYEKGSSSPRCFYNFNQKTREGAV